ncbi:hypothetical protein [Roseibaca sp. Y0-43]|uniref:hypothetical protein n=1 Tax=Roseibaca sp. Y0-43 TaxID=2816854 RepID=UPI001D0C9D92|nr:hypothetical protein [Roseibaca sp. Y0-43]MCC1480424.1 hypothetical protein [Roseibaca sp. Y0-43]
MKTATLAFCAALLAAPATADPFLEAMNAAIEAYQDGDVVYAQDELNEAQRLLSAMKADGLQAFLPEAPEGMTREIDQEANAVMAMLGGGTSANATYSGNGTSFTINLIADSPMVAQMAMMLSNNAMVTQMGGQIERINRVRFLRADGSLQAIIANRILVQAEGNDLDAIIPVLETMDFRAMESFGG